MSIILWACVLLQFWTTAHGYVFELGESELIKNYTQTGNTYTIYLSENNHINGSDNLLLFTIKDAGSEPTWRFVSHTVFTYKSVLVENTKDYAFFIKQYIDYETEEYHFYSLYTVLGSSEVITILINTINYDDENPTLTAPMCKMKENTDYNESTTECIATLTDPDGWLNQTTFSIINSNPNANSSIEKEDDLFKFSFEDPHSDTVYNMTVYLTTQQQLDYEKKIFYSFIVQARDGANHTTLPNENVTCIVDVQDMNDMPPTWTDYFSTKQLTEKQSYNFNVTAVDGDRGINADVNYTLLTYDQGICQGSCVAVTTENKKGIITVYPIDRDAKDLSTYKFTIMAMEEDEPPFNVTLDITFYIEDIDDNNPLFMNVTRHNDTTDDFKDITTDKVSEFTFYENFAETIDGLIAIQDIDTGVNAQFTVELLEDDARQYTNESYTRAFLVIPTAGYRSGDFQISVRNVTCLDFENQPWQNFSFYVHSYGFNKSKEDHLLVKIHLLDYNDELPKFANLSYTTEVEETIGKGETLIQVKATDRDAEDAILKHQLVGASSITKLMTIDSAEGIIKVAVDNAFDYDRMNPVIFQVQAIDAVNHTTTVSVTIKLKDVNNKAPTYKVDEVIRVDENQRIGMILNATITASDVDTTRNLTAEIDWQKSYAMKNSQKLNASKAEVLQAMQFLDLEFEKFGEDDSIAIRLIVNDNNREETAPDYETFDTLYLDVKITDLNTKLPEFKKEMSIDALIVVNINDINDNPPIFTPDTLNKNLSAYEAARIHSVVGTIEAIDADVGDVVSYSCTYVDEQYDWFDCDENGQITAKTSKIDADTGPVISVGIDCIATDKLWRTPQRFYIFIIDTNNKWPQFNKTGEKVKVLEKSNAGTPITTIGYTDADRDVPFHTAECYINRTDDDDCHKSFKIENNVLMVLNGGKDIDRDFGKPNFTCSVTCRDNPNLERNEGQNSNTSSLIIELIDINDHCPDMVTTNVQGSENIKKGGWIDELIADDWDEGPNADIDMSVMTVIKHESTRDVNYTDKGLFRIVKKVDEDYVVNLTRKRLHLVADKDLKGYYGEYTLQVELHDEGTPPQSTEDVNNTYYKEKARIKLHIEKYNYQAPVFVFPNSTRTFSLSSVQTAGKPLAMFYSNESFSDLEIFDDENNACTDKWKPKFDVKLIGTSEALTSFFKTRPIGTCTAQLEVTDFYNKTEAIDNTYQVRLTATLENKAKKTDAQEADYSTSMDININFIDFNEDPIFNETLGPWNISLLENDQTLVAPLPPERQAYYRSSDDSSTILKYYFLESDDVNVTKTIGIEEKSGNVKLRRALDFLDKRFYEFTIKTSRDQSGTSKRSASNMQVNLQVIEINKYTPQWTSQSFYGSILKSSQPGSTVVTANATDRDEIDRGKLTYSIEGAIVPTGSESINNIVEPFKLNQLSGAVTLNFQVDYNMNGYFIFGVKVKDVPDNFGHGPHENFTTVTIHIVTEENTVAFRFENDLDAVVDKRNHILDTISSALGWTCNDQLITHESQNGVTLNNVTVANIYCVDKNNTLLTADDMKMKLNNINTYQTLRQNLLKFGILMQTFNSDKISTVNLEATLKAALIGVSVVLGASCIVLAVTFFLKTRELNRRLTKLTRQEFGSDESNLNRKGINVPTANVFAVEGSNPVFNTEIIKNSMMDEVSSIHSDNSDLIGVEDSPEFDNIFGKEKF